MAGGPRSQFNWKRGYFWIEATNWSRHLRGSDEISGVAWPPWMHFCRSRFEGRACSGTAPGWDLIHGCQSWRRAGQEGMTGHVEKDRLRRVTLTWVESSPSCWCSGVSLHLSQCRVGAAVVFSHRSTREDGGTQDSYMANCPGGRGPPPNMLAFRRWT